MSIAEVVLVVGPPRAGVSGMVAGLQQRMPAVRFVEEVGAGPAPAAVVFVVSAAAPVVESDCALADRVAEQTGVLVVVVSKIDDHRGWREALAAGRQTAGRASAALSSARWVGAAAAPRLGDPQLDDAVAAVADALGSPSDRARNTLRVRQSRVRRLRDQRDALVLQRRRARLTGGSAAHRGVRQARVTLTHTARRRCAALRAELLREAAGVGRGDISDFPQRVRQRCADVLDAIDRDITDSTDNTDITDIADAGADLRVGPAAPAEIDVADPPPRSWPLERRLTAVLGAGFGFGIALVVTRLVTGLVPGLTPAGLVAGCVIGVVTTTWVVRTRALLHDRVLLQAWAGEAAAAVRAAAEERIGIRMLAVETATAVASAVARADEDADLGRRIAALDAEIGQLSGPVDGANVLPVGRPAGRGHLNRSCE